MSLADELTANNGFQNVIKAPAHETQFFVQDCPADRAERAIKPAKLFDLGEVSIYDMGENISGYPVVAATVDGANITVRCSEEINPDGTLNFDSCDRGQIQKMNTATRKRAKSACRGLPGTAFGISS